MGAYTDTDPYPTKTCDDPQPLEGINRPWGEKRSEMCITDAQIERSLSLRRDHHLQKGMDTIFYLLTPPGITVCLDGRWPQGSLLGLLRWQSRKRS